VYSRSHKICEIFEHPCLRTCTVSYRCSLCPCAWPVFHMMYRRLSPTRPFPEANHLCGLPFSCNPAIFVSIL